MDQLSQGPVFSTDPKTKGFDLLSGNKWIYPENYPVRQYQFTIVKTSLFHNTLVCLPTGLGKTFIAAVVMYNFWRWYPSGLIVFLAPTKPLVAQQVDACHDIMGIPISQTVELTGDIHQKQREIEWRSKRVIFATPQTFQKDLEKGIVKTELIKCIVIDEAHKALGKHAYCESIRLLNQTNRYYRVLGLSATPGGKLAAVQNVIRNLHITRLELRDDASSDVLPYINERKLEIIKVGLGDHVAQFLERYVEVIDPHFRQLLKSNIIRGTTSNITKGRIFNIRKEFMSRQNKPHNYGSIIKTLNILLSMCHAKDLLINHGLRAFVHFCKNHSDKFWMKNDKKLISLLDEIKEFIGPFPQMEALVGDNDVNIRDNLIFGHEKFNKLREILSTHFENALAKNTDTRAIVFIEYRDIVHEVFLLLLHLRPLIRPQVFVGQAGLKQKQQKKALEDFRSNRVNVLISTSIGEEGLDVGEVDLIICFDILQNSPTRLVQRMGRTGRKRNGHIIILVTDDREYTTLKCALAKKDSLNTKILQSSSIVNALGKDSPRMIPPNLNPECFKMHMTVISSTSRSKKQRKKIETKMKKKNIDDNKKKKLKKSKQTSSDKMHSSEQMHSTIKKFLSANFKHDNCTEDNDIVSMKISEVSRKPVQTQVSQNNVKKMKLTDVKLLTSDSELLEFLTLCALKQSEREMGMDEKLLKISYIPLPSIENTDSILNFAIPSLSTLNCIKILDEYIPPAVEHYAENDEAFAVASWESDHISHFVNNSRCPELILTNGRFEDLLDDTSDSDKTFLSGDYSFDDQYVDGKHNENTMENVTQHKNNNSINEKNLSHSVVIGGAFEDLLDESSNDTDDEINEQWQEIHGNFDNNISSKKAEEIPVISILNSKSSDLSNRVNNEKENNLSQCHVEMIKQGHEKIERRSKSNLIKVDSNFDLDIGSDFHCRDNCESKSSDNLMKISCASFVDSIHNKSIYSSTLNVMSKATSQKIQAVNNRRINGTNGSVSPDLTKLSQHRLQKKSNESSNTTLQQPISFQSPKKTAVEMNSTDNDIFGVESLLVDSDFEDQITAIEISDSTNTMQSNSFTDQTHLSRIMQLTKKTENFLTGQSLKKNSISDHNFFDELEWSSDCEISSAPITESKYFTSNSLVTLHQRLSVQSSDEYKNFSRFYSEKNERAIVRSKYESKKNLMNTQKKSLSRKRSNSRKDSDIDDFIPKKIQKTMFREIDYSWSDDDNPSKLAGGELSIQLSNAKGKKSSTKNLNKFITSKSIEQILEVLPKEKVTQLQTTSSNSPDSYQKKRKTSNRRYGVKNAFICDEAEVSSSGAHSEGSSCEEDDDTNNKLADFVSHSQYHDTTVDMTAYYLQSIKSPQQPGKFLIKGQKTPTDIAIYSQVISDEPNTYINDSFCVGDDDVSVDTDDASNDISILTEMELNLKNKNLKRKSSSTTLQHKRIIRNFSNDTSDEETENMRAEIAEQSIMMKNR